MGGKPYSGELPFGKCGEYSLLKRLRPKKNRCGLKPERIEHSGFIHSFMHHQKLGPRAEYRRQEGERIRSSPTLAERFNTIKSLSVDLAFFGPDNLVRSSHIKYTVNLAHAKSVFRFDCPNPECVQGDFDLSVNLAAAIAARDTNVTGEVVCRGWRSKTTIDKVTCGHILHYKLTVGY